MPRHPSTAFAELNFRFLKHEGSYSALCLYCGRFLKNTASKRIQAHRNICTEKIINEKESSEEASSSAKVDSDTPLEHREPGESGEPSKKIMRIRSDVWKFFTLDTETEHATCKYCDKKYKKNVTRMQEHLRTCENFQASEDKMEFLTKHRVKKVHSIENMKLHNDVLVEEIGMDSQLLGVDHRRDVENDHYNYTSFMTEEKKRDEFDIFGEHVANELRKLRAHALLLANTKYELNKILHQSLVEYLKHDEIVSVDVMDNMPS